MQSIKDVINYSNSSYNDVLNLPIDIFLLMRKNYIIDQLRETPQGQEYLENCERYKITKPERGILKRMKNMSKAVKK